MLRRKMNNFARRIRLTITCSLTDNSIGGFPLDWSHGLFPPVLDVSLYLTMRLLLCRSVSRLQLHHLSGAKQQHPGQSFCCGTPSSMVYSAWQMTFCRAERRGIYGHNTRFDRAACAL